MQNISFLWGWVVFLVPFLTFFCHFPKISPPHHSPPPPNLQTTPPRIHKDNNCYFVTQKEHPARQKLKCFHEKNSIFLLKKTTQPRKKLKFCMKILSFFTQKDLPASQKTEILHQKNDKKGTKKTTQPRKN